MDTEKKIIIVLSTALVLLSLITALLVQRSTLSGSRAGSALASMATPTSPDGLMHMLSGHVTAIGSNSLTIEAVLPGNTSPSEVTVTVSTGTAITLQTQKDPQTLAKEMQDYQKQLSASEASASSTPATMPSPPMPFVSKTISLSGVTVGMTVTVTPAANTKQDATTIIAQSITILAIPSTPASAIPPSPTAGVQGGSVSAPVIPPSPTAGTQGGSTPPPTAPTPLVLPPSPTAK